ncbi:MAG: MerR family transcriptional regulator [Clostridiales bacterium]|nr:MAG: MerR family transcriptional regulator [Clostridiales bacterium]
MKLTIGKMAKLNNISQQTLRLYDKLGLLRPYIVDKKNGYRYYEYKQCAKLDMILHLKQMGMSLKEILEFFNQKNPQFLTQKLKQHINSIDSEINDLEIRKKTINRVLNSLEKYSIAPKDSTITVEFLPKRVIYKMNTDLNFYDYDIGVYEKILRQLKKKLIEENKAKLYFYNAGTRMSKENFLNNKFVSHEIFVFVEEEDFSCQKLDYIDAGLFLCIYCDDFNKEKKYINKLLHKVKSENYTIVGDYICETIAELPILSKENERGMFIKLQVPIKID